MKTVFINGCFDILHRGHIEFFKYAKSIGDKLIVAIDSDDRVSKMKGKSRPVNCFDDRVFVLNSIKYIDEVYGFNSNIDLEVLLFRIKPEVMIVGSDWKDKEIVGSKYAKELQFFNRIEQYSTTKVLQRSFDK